MADGAPSPKVRNEGKSMNTTDIIYLAVALAAIGGAIAGFNALVGKGPRGTLLIVATCLFTWGSALPLVLFYADDMRSTREAELFATVLQLSGIGGAILYIMDLFHQRARKPAPIAEWLLAQPVLWGSLICGGVYLFLSGRATHSPILWRYFASHPILIVTTALFLVALAALVMRLGKLLAQFTCFGGVVLDPIPAGGQTIGESGKLLADLFQLPARFQETYLVRRIREAIQFVRRKDSADGLDAYLRHLEELDLANMNAAYASVRIIIWAIPILGFLGTVVGITMAIANLTPEALEQSMPEVTAGLGVAFDTTALALALVMVLMFMKSSVERVEERLLAAVDTRVSEELVGRFQTDGSKSDPSVATIRRMSEEVLTAVEKLTVRQAQLWKASIDDAQQHWSEATASAGKIVRDSLATTLKSNLNHHAELLNENVLKHADRLSASAAEHADKLTNGAQDTVGRLREGLERLAELLVEALHQHGEVLTASERDLAQENRRHLSEVEAALGEAMVVSADRQELLIKQSEHLLKEMQVALVEAAGATVRQQEQLVKQSDVLLRVVDATGQITELENALNRNLSAIGQSANFEELVFTLSAAIQLLNARLGQLPPAARGVKLDSGTSAPQAAA
jgi:biopolymer transport protein ExbB/TolQ